jgi:ADP-ribosylglycohydrolase
VRASLKGIGPAYVSVTANAYLRWLRTQGRRPGVGVEVRGEEEGFLMGLRSLHRPRAPGQTCISALEVMDRLGAPARNDSKGCGGVMRVAPAALHVHGARVGDAAFVFGLATELAGLTHGHPTGKLAAGAFAAMLVAILEGADLRRAAVVAMDLLRAHDNGEEVTRALSRALDVADASDGPSDLAIRELGEGWVAEEALAIALYCALTARDLESGIVAAVNHDGDSDSTGSIAGNLLGAMHGEEAIPFRWLESLELREEIAEVAEDLFMCGEWRLSEYDDGPVTAYYWGRYPGY